MGYFYYMYDWTILLMIPALILAGWAQYRVTGDFKKYSQVYASKGWAAENVCELMLRNNGVYDVRIEQTGGSLTDHYDPRTNVIRLSQSTYGGRSVAAIAVAAHETGHAIQDHTGYSPLRIRNALAPVVSFASNIALPVALLGMIFGYGTIARIALIVFFAMLLFQLVTLPVEFNASRRAMDALESEAILTRDELAGAKRVLTSAALTYVAATVSALMQFLRILLLNRRRQR